VVAFALGEFFKEGKLGVESAGWGSVLGREKARTENDQPHLVGAQDAALNESLWLPLSGLLGRTHSL
jgi:hypothetical protein